MYDLLVKGGTVIDPAQGIRGQRDIGISLGKIAALGSDIPSGQAKKVINATGRIVTPGLIDMHAHVADGVFQRAVAPDDVGVLSGVTTVCDAGSTGWANFTPFRRYVIPRARTHVFAYLNLSSTGLVLRPEIWCWQNIEPEAMLKTIAENRDIIKGVKVRAVGALAKNPGVEAIRVAKKIANEARLPLVIHLGIDAGEPVSGDTMDTFTRDMLPLLEKGDILCHPYQWKPGGVMRPDGSVLAGFKEALARGVLLDLAQSAVHWSLDLARKGLEQGIVPDIVSSDVVSLSLNDSVFNLPATMSRFLAIGLTLEQLVEMTTINPARALGEEQRRGSLRIGMPADVSILELTEGDFTFADGIAGKTFKGDRLLVPRLTLKSGVEVETMPRFR